MRRVWSSFRHRSPVADRILRQYTCTRCGAITLVCGPCDHGRVLCGDCSSLSRLQRSREAAERYRHTERGRRMACLRQRRCRALKTRIVTHGWSTAVAPEVTLPVPTRMCVVLEPSDEKTAVKHCAFCGRWGPLATRIGFRLRRVTESHRDPRQPVWKGAP